MSYFCRFKLLLFKEYNFTNLGLIFIQSLLDLLLKYVTVMSIKSWIFGLNRFIPQFWIQCLNLWQTIDLACCIVNLNKILFRDHSRLFGWKWRNFVIFRIKLNIYPLKLNFIRNLFVVFLLLEFRDFFINQSLYALNDSLLRRRILLWKVVYVYIILLIRIVVHFFIVLFGRCEERWWKSKHICAIFCWVKFLCIVLRLFKLVYWVNREAIFLRTLHIKRYLSLPFPV